MSATKAYEGLRLSACRNQQRTKASRTPTRIQAGHQRKLRKGATPAHQDKATWQLPLRPRAPLPPQLLPSVRTSNRSRRAVRVDSALFKSERRTPVTLPAVVIRVPASTAEDSATTIDTAVAAGATAILLEDDIGGEAGAGQLYEAACFLKGLLRGRGALFVAGRADVAGAAEADGVALTGGSLPTVVARRTMQAARESSSGTPIVARFVETLANASSAEKEGADVLFVDNPSLVPAVREKVSIPIICTTSGQWDDPTEAAPREALEGLVGEGLDGICMPLPATAAAECVGSAVALLAPEPEPEAPPAEEEKPSDPAHKASGSRLINVAGPGQELVEEERELLQRAQDLVAAVGADAAGAGLLEDAVASLEELFLLVVVGEFNSGKSSVINALLGGKFLREGVTPTTNEINLLRWGEEDALEQGPDGRFERFVNSDVLREINIVDTPGTNVILERQQKLTEEFVPRADLVMFILSADRPFSDSEVAFLKYIRRWEKKIVFVVNKADLLTPDELQEVIGFVEDNIVRTLGVKDMEVLPVSARLAMNAKLQAQGLDTASAGNFFGGDGTQAGVLTADLDGLSEDPNWQQSGFASMEDYVYGFLGGSRGSSGEALRLKLGTPLSVASKVLDALGAQLAEEMAAAEQEQEAAASIHSQLQRFAADMNRDGQIQRQRVGKVLRSAAARAEQLVDSILRVSNVSQLQLYLSSSTSAASLPVQAGWTSVVGGADEDLQEALTEHEQWIATNCQRQTTSKLQFLSSRGFDTPGSPPEGANSAATDGEETSLAVASEFSQEAAARLLEEEIREAVVGTVGAAAGAVAAGLGAVVVLPETLEDALALLLASAVAYVGVLNLPLRRAEAKKKVQRSASKLLEQLEATMEQEMTARVGTSIEYMEQAMQPWEASVDAEVQRVAAAEQQRQELVDQLSALQQRVRSLQ